MRIDGTNSGHIVSKTTVEGGASGAKTSATNAADGHTRDDSQSVVIHLGAAAADADNVASLAAARVAVTLQRIRAELDAGTYKLDLDTLAEKIVDDELARAVGARA